MISIKRLSHVIDTRTLIRVVIKQIYYTKLNKIANTNYYFDLLELYTKLINKSFKETVVIIDSIFEQYWFNVVVTCDVEYKRCNFKLEIHDHAITRKKDNRHRKNM